MGARASQQAVDRMLRWVLQNQGRWRFASRDRVLEATFARATRTFAAAVRLTNSGYGAQGAMLARSLYEDVVVAYWLTWVKADPEWVMERLNLEQRYRTYLLRTALGGEEAAKRETRLSGPELRELRALFGAHGEYSWWQRERERVPTTNGRAPGTRLQWRKRSLPHLVRALERHRDRLTLIAIPGETSEAVDMAVRRLLYLSSVVNPVNNQHLHHGAAGIAGTYVDLNGVRRAAPSSEDWAPLTCSSLHMTFEALLFLSFTRGHETLMQEYLRQRRPFELRADEFPWLGDEPPPVG